MHYATLVILPEGSTEEDLAKHLEPFQDYDAWILPADIPFYFDEYPDYVEYVTPEDVKDYESNRVPITFWDWYQVAPRGRWAFPTFNVDDTEGMLPDSYLPVKTLATRKYAAKIDNDAYYLSLYQKGEITSQEWQKVLDKDIHWQFATHHIEQRVYTPNYIVTPTGIIYENDERLDWDSLCLDLYREFSDGYVAWLVDVHD